MEDQKDKYGLRLANSGCILEGVRSISWKWLCGAVAAGSLVASCNSEAAQIGSSNEIAYQLYKKYGFHEEGNQKEQAFIKGEYVDELWMAKFYKS
jgi:L-amino acid N-acyltransferase YncA